ncbi:urea carboxylase-associated family protein (plasmid) [Aliisedimentitalea scapharcae]|uniref:Urea carboxylase-associated family protein n=1 Tax=Aliisedimentitalea scapharcae TaxID=1524259 RepID=A0ABZ2XYU7_9RHOB
MTVFDPGQPDGTNRSLDIAISADGSPEPGRLYTIAARCGMAVRVNAGQTLTISNPSGHQVCDFWIFASDDLGEYSSMEHLHTALGSIFPKVGDGITSNLRHDLMTITEDTSPGVHDTVIASCDHARYQQLGCAEYHDNCADNLRQALIAIGLRAPAIPAPFNLWMNVPVRADGSTSFEPPVSAPGDQMSFRAETDVVAVMSACPQDVTPVNGVGTTPDTLEFRVTGG